MKNEKRLPALLLPGSPELLYWPKVPLEIDGQVVVPDILVRLRTGKQVDWAVVEVDEGGIATPDSLERERLLGLPTLRVSERDILRSDFVDHLVRRLQTLLGLQAVGYRGPNRRATLAAAPPRPELRRPKTRRSDGWNEGAGAQSCC